MAPLTTALGVNPSSLFLLFLLAATPLMLARPTLAQDLSVTVATGTGGDVSVAPPTRLANQTTPGYAESTRNGPPETGLSTPSSGGDGDDEDLPPVGGTRCQGYYDVMGQWDPPFNCNAGVFLYCCGTCFYRFCCQFRQQSLDQSICSNYDTPIWANTGKPVGTVTEGQGNLDRDRTHLIVYIICGVVAIMVLVGIFTKLGLEKSRGGSGEGAGGGGGMGNAHNDIGNTRTLTDLLKQPGGEVSSSDHPAGGSPLGRRANGFSSKMLRSRSEQYHLNTAAYGPYGQALAHPHSSHSAAGLNKYTSLKAVADSRSYYKSYPLMDFAQYQPAAPPALAPVSLRQLEKSYLHPAPHNIHVPLSIAIPPSHLEHARLPKPATHPSLSSSAFKSWEPRGRQVQRQTSAPIHPSARRHAYSAARQQSIENMPDLFSQPCVGAYGGAGHGLGYQSSHPPHPPHPPYYHHTRHKSYSTHSKTEVTV